MFLVMLSFHKTVPFARALEHKYAGSIIRFSIPLFHPPFSTLPFLPLPFYLFNWFLSLFRGI